MTSSSPKSSYSKSRAKSQPTVVQTTIRLHMDDDGNMTYFYPNGTQITDQSLINKIKRTDEFKAEKDRMQREHNQEMLDKVIEHNKTNNDLININKLCPEKILIEQDYIDELNNLKVEEYQKREFDIPMPTEESVKADLLKIATKEIKSMAVWTLKKKREEFGLDLDRISNDLRIKSQYLLALENNEFQSLPGSAYVIGFIKTYATYLKLDANAIVPTDNENNNEEKVPDEEEKAEEILNM